MAVNFKLFKLYTRIYYNFLLGKINNSIPKLNINISGIKIGIGFDHQLVDSVPTENHDHQLDMVVMPSREIRR